MPSSFIVVSSFCGPAVDQALAPIILLDSCGVKHPRARWEAPAASPPNDGDLVPPLGTRSAKFAAADLTRRAYQWTPRVALTNARCSALSRSLGLPSGKS